MRTNKNSPSWGCNARALTPPELQINVKGEEFKHPGNGTSYRLKHYLTCMSEWIIYILWSPCNLIYVGETTCDLKTRLNNHRYSIRKKRMDLPVSKHCSEKGHSEWDIRYMILDFVPPLRRGGDSLTQHKRKELEWIHRIDSLKPRELNVEFRISSKMIR